MRKRLRSTIKWSGTVLTVLLLVVWVGSAWIGFGVKLNPTTIGGIGGGRLWMLADNSGALRDALAVGEWTPGVSVHSMEHFWWFHYVHVTTRSLKISRTEVGIPLWPLLALAAMPICWCWWKKRRCRAPGMCTHCGYDLRGAAHAVCPECGAKCERIDRRPAEQVSGGSPN